MYIYNVVLYDGEISWVTKFILKKKTYKEDIKKWYANSDVRILLIDKLSPILFHDIMDYKLSDDNNNNLIYERFIKMYA